MAMRSRKKMTKPGEEASDPRSGPLGRIRGVGASGALLTVQIALKADVAKKITENWERDKRASNHKMLMAIRAIASGREKPRTRNRAGCIQAQVPKELRDRFLALAELAEGKERAGADIVRSYLERWVNLNNGARLRQKHSLDYERPEPSREYQRQGRNALKNATAFATYTFDAGRAKKAVQILALELDLNMSEFFSAILYRACKRLDRKRGVQT